MGEVSSHTYATTQLLKVPYTLLGQAILLSPIYLLFTLFHRHTFIKSGEQKISFPEFSQRSFSLSLRLTSLSLLQLCSGCHVLEWGPWGICE